MTDDEQRRLVEQLEELRVRYPAARDALKQAFYLGVAAAAVLARDNPPMLTVGVQCSECGTNIIVMPARLMKAIGDSFGGAEGELQFLEQLKTQKAKTGDRLAVADADGRYACPACDHQGQLPPEYRQP